MCCHTRVEILSTSPASPPLRTHPPTSRRAQRVQRSVPMIQTPSGVFSIHTSAQRAFLPSRPRGQGGGERCLISAHVPQAPDNSPFSICSRINTAADWGFLGPNEGGERFLFVAFELAAGCKETQRSNVLSPGSRHIQGFFSPPPSDRFINKPQAQRLLCFLRCPVNPSGSQREGSWRPCLKSTPAPRLHILGFS